MHEIDREGERKKKSEYEKPNPQSHMFTNQIHNENNMICYGMLCVCTTVLSLALCTVSIFHLFINFDGYAAGEIN